jgi:hypothetical protein
MFALDTVEQALETPTLVLMIGGLAGKPFEPDWEPLET